MSLPIRNVQRRSAEKKEHDVAVFSWVSDALGASKRLDPAERPLE